MVKYFYYVFPFSISPTFQLRNTNQTLEESIGMVESIQELCIKNGKQLVIYLSMGFGNPYGDPWHEDILLHWADVMAAKAIHQLSLADTVGLASPEQISFALKTLIPKYPEIRFGVHLHATHNSWKKKVAASLEAGCTRFDGALKGIGGCPMAQDELVGNLDSELMIAYFKELGILKNINEQALAESLLIANQLFS